MDVMIVIVETSVRKGLIVSGIPIVAAVNVRGTSSPRDRAITGTTTMIVTAVRGGRRGVLGMGGMGMVAAVAVVSEGMGMHRGVEGMMGGLGGMVVVEGVGDGDMVTESESETAMMGGVIGGSMLLC